MKRKRNKATRLKLNSFFESAHGEMDGHVIRTYRGRQFRQKKPVFTQPWGEGTVKQRGRFSGADAWYASVIKPNPALVDLYRAKGRKEDLNYRQMALRDWFNPPEVRGVHSLSSAPGAARRFWLDVHDDFEVVRVTVIVRASDGTPILETEVPATKGDFFLELPLAMAEANPTAAVEITAYDRPGNATTGRFPLPKPPPPEPTSMPPPAGTANSTEPGR